MVTSLDKKEQTRLRVQRYRERKALNVTLCEGQDSSVDSNNGLKEGIKSNKQREKEALETNRTRIKEYMDDLWADWKDKKDKEAGKQWKDAMKYLAPLVESKQSQIDIPDSQLVDICKRVQKLYATKQKEK